MTGSVKAGFLEGLGEYVRLRSALDNGEGAVSVFGLGEAHRIHAAASLYRDTNRTVLYVVPSQMAAVKTHGEFLHYIPDALLFPARELPLAVRHYTESASVTAGRFRT